MKPSHRLVALTFTMATLALAITLTRTLSAQAAPPRQIEDPITRTLQDANQSLGGDFVLDPDNSVMKRTRQGAYANGDPVDITDYMSITSETPNTYCNSYPGEFWHPSTFHGRDGCTLAYGEHPANVIWEVPFGSQARGDDVVFDVGSIVDDCYCYVQHPDAGPKVSSDSINVTPLAEALNQAAIKNGVYEPMPGEIMPSNPAPVVPDQPGQPSDQTVPADTGGLFGIPWPIMLGNLGVPIVAALAGAAVSGAVAAAPKDLSIKAERWTSSNLHPLVELFPFDLRMDAFKADMQKIDVVLLQHKKYVGNPWSGYPLADPIVSKANQLGDWWESKPDMPGTNTRKGWTCGEYVDFVHHDVLEAAEAHFPGAKVTKHRLVEQSTLDYEKGTWNPITFADGWLGDNGHILDKLETQNGTARVEMGVDFWSHSLNKAPIVRPYDEAIAPWKNAVGLAREFVDMEWVDKSPVPEPKTPEALNEAKRTREEFLKGK